MVVIMQSTLSIRSRDVKSVDDQGVNLIGILNFVNKEFHHIYDSVTLEGLGGFLLLSIDCHQIVTE